MDLILRISRLKWMLVSVPVFLGFAYLFYVIGPKKISEFDSSEIHKRPGSETAEKIPVKVRSNIWRSVVVSFMVFTGFATIRVVRSPIIITIDQNRSGVVAAKNNLFTGKVTYKGFVKYKGSASLNHRTIVFQPKLQLTDGTYIEAIKLTVFIQGGQSAVLDVINHMDSINI